MEEDKYKVPLFNGKNFSNWKFRMEILLEEQELLDFVTEEPTTYKDKKRQLKCKSLIIQRISDSHLEYVKDKKSAKEIWDTLKEIFEKKGVAGRLHLIRKLLTMEYDERDSLKSHLILFENRLRELQGSGQQIDKSFVISMLLLTLPHSYDIIVIALETMSDDKQTLNFVKSKLLDIELQRTDNNKKVKDISGTAFSGNANKYPSKKPGFQFKCYNCGRIGHKCSDCRVKIQKPKTQQKTSKANHTQEISVEIEDVAFHTSCSQ